jgi:hypothetical protein
MLGAPDPIYVRARQVLLDALEALQEHRSAVLLVGAQAIYLHTGEAHLAVEPYTTDADLALNPAVLASDPKLESLMTRAGFTPAPGSGQVGTWIGRHDVPVDLMVPEAVGGSGRRAARLPSHGDRVARKARGLEAALVDNTIMLVGALESADGRSFNVAVAGPSALLVAKLHKLADRQTTPRRQDNKDALDVYRLLVGVQTEIFVAAINTLLHDPISGLVTGEALEHLEKLYGTAMAPGAQMAGQATIPLEDPAAIADSCAALAGDLPQAL